MTEEEKNIAPEDDDQKDKEQEPGEETETAEVTIEAVTHSLKEANDKYIRLYADFENYKKVTARNKEELLKYANEDLMTDILTVIDHLELALQHADGDEQSDSLAEGVELTLKELHSVLKKHGLVTIEAIGKPFDPVVHHAMSQIESEEAEENTVVKEFRKGYKLRDRVIRAALVGVAIKPSLTGDTESKKTENENVISEE